MNGSSPQPRVPSEEVAGLVERVKFFNNESAFAVLREKVAFAKQCGAAPPNATEDTHPHVRALFKQCVLAVQYCMGPDLFAKRIGSSVDRARELLRLHHETFHTFWMWSDAAVNHASLHCEIQNTFGWRMEVNALTSERTLRNFPMQANAAAMMQLACCFATER